MSNLFKQGEHICVLYDTEEEQLSIAADYLADGLRGGERCLYVGRSVESLTGFRAALRRLGIHADVAVKRGALVLAVSADAHLIDGRFDCERMLRLLNDAVEAALNDGFSALRTCGDMSWLLEDAPGSHEVVEYEALLNEFFRSVRAAGMCQYNRQRLPAHLVGHGLATHSSLFVDGRHTANPSYEPASIAFRPVAPLAEPS